jgi:hypothetical protein
MGAGIKRAINLGGLRGAVAPVWVLVLLDSVNLQSSCVDSIQDIFFDESTLAVHDSVVGY